MTLFSLENLYQQYIACRKNKRNTANALRFEARGTCAVLPAIGWWPPSGPRIRGSRPLCC